MHPGHRRPARRATLRLGGEPPRGGAQQQRQAGHRGQAEQAHRRAGGRDRALVVVAGRADEGAAYQFLSVRGDDDPGRHDDGVVTAVEHDRLPGRQRDRERGRVARPSLSS